MTEVGDDVQHQDLRPPEQREKKKMPMYLIIWIGAMIGIFIGIGIVIA